MDKKIEKDLLVAAQNPEKRASIFYELGQNWLKPLFDRDLEEAVFSIFNFLLVNKEQWKTTLMTPEHYRRDTSRDVFGDINYTVRDYFSWCVLYPEEVDTYFKNDAQGNVVVKENPKIRILDKDNKKEVYKTELGKRLLIEVKKDRETLIETGFSLGQKDTLLTVCLVGLMALPPGYKKVDRAEIKPKKITYNAKEKLEAKELIKEAIATQQVKMTIKQSTELSLLFLAQHKEDLTLKSAQKYLKNHLKEKNA